MNPLNWELTQPSQCTKEPTFVEELSGRLEKAIGQATALRGRVRTIVERAHGAKGDENESVVPVPSVTLEAVRQQLNLLERLLEDTARQSNQYTQPSRRPWSRWG